ncbi:formate hydrogenlyase complex iron-sulfur subunit [Serratia sp. UGAL515B_01]|uniref:formate hydrogenlyase complex iron-sulfur subunit n=1 Tax=Serratia sp. UGAL515B_01 TaxID=2986763 RepID=UPI0029536E71|nr:formate hydrogenlyase complex iron-sulfur subunit [Serratia sp. UGAL515B_01]WON78637.1 formate hydrogenlyase complex iron-sulfur subunit [Serratia sp. UGAL515B_01]
MLKLIRKVLKTGHATTAYPAQPLEVDPNFRGKPEYHPQQCIACGACTNACPSNALTMTTDTTSGTLRWQLFLGRCIFCARCEEVCPTTAIRLSQQFELAVWRKEDLYQQADFAICHCRQCGKPYATQKEIDYALTLLSGTLPASASLRARFETCASCKQQQSMIQADSIDVGRHLTREVI